MKKLLLLTLTLLFPLYLNGAYTKNEGSVEITSLSTNTAIKGQGTKITVKGTGFTPDSNVFISLDSGNSRQTIGTVDTQGYAHHITLSSDGSKAYIADGESGISILTLGEIAASFFVQTETKALYPSGTSNASFITSVYQNLFNREPDTAGLNYWEDELSRGVHTRDSFIQVVINGAKDDATSQDKTILDNKTRVGLSFSEAGLTNVTDAKTIMSGVNANEDSIDSALNVFNLI